MEKKENIVMSKSYAFALRIIKLYKHLINNQKEYVLSKQVLIANKYTSFHVFNILLKLHIAIFKMLVSKMASLIYFLPNNFNRYINF